MYVDLNQWYVENNIQSRLDQLTPSMLKPAKRKAKPHLRGKGAEIRALVPWAHAMSERLLADDNTEEGTAKVAMFHLNQCYEQLSRDVFQSAAMREHSRKFALLFVALEQLYPKAWHVVPKLHLWQEMNEMSPSRPSMVWGYRDESFGGYLASLCRKKGGKNSPVAAGRSMLYRFQARHNIPVI